LSDYEGISALERRYDLGSRSYQEWSHMWVNNPVWQRAPELGIGWVLEDARQRIVGSIGSVPLRCEFDGRELVAGTGSSWVTDEQYRGYAPLLLDRFLSQPGADLHIVVGPNPHAQPIVAVHAARVPAGAWDRAAFWITNHWAFAGSALAKRNFPFQRLLRVPAWAAMGLRDAFTRDRLRAGSRGGGRLEVTTCAAFDDRFDDFWERLRAASRQRKLYDRSRAVIESHFARQQTRGAACIGTASTGGRLAAYGVFCRDDVGAIGLRRVRLLDYQSADGDTSPLRAILAAAVRRCRREGIAVLECVGWRLEPGDFMDRVAPFSRTLPSWQYFYRATDPELARKLEDRDAWNPWQFEGDVCL
jgi:hypothetical protein